MMQPTANWTPKQVSARAVSVIVAVIDGAVNAHDRNAAPANVFWYRARASIQVCSCGLRAVVCLACMSVNAREAATAHTSQLPRHVLRYTTVSSSVQ